MKTIFIICLIAYPQDFTTMGYSGLPLTALVTSECIPYHDVSYRTFPNASMDITTSRKKREAVSYEDIRAKSNNTPRGDAYINVIPNGSGGNGKQKATTREPLSTIPSHVTSPLISITPSEYLAALCKTFKRALPQTQNEFVLLLSAIAYRYSDQSIQQKVKKDTPNNTLDWEILFNKVKLEYGTVEPLLKATSLNMIPQNEAQWCVVKNWFRASKNSILDFDVAKRAELIVEMEQTSSCDYLKAFKDFATIIYPFLLAPLPQNYEEAIEKCKNLFQKCKDVDEKCIVLEEKCLSYRKCVWTVLPRVFLDDIEAIYKNDYDDEMRALDKAEQENKEKHKAMKGPKKPYVPMYTKPSMPTHDPKAMRMKKKALLWRWIFTKRTDMTDVALILKNMESQFRKLHKPPIPTNDHLTEHQKEEFEKFKNDTCEAIGVVHETASFLIYGNQALDLFEGELEELNVFGKNIDPYLVPVMNAIAPLTDPKKPPATFVKNGENSDMN